MPIHVGSGHTLGERGGEQAHTLTHRRDAGSTPTSSQATTAQPAAVDSPTNARVPGQRSTNLYAAHANLRPRWTPGRVATSAAVQAHQNMQPYLTLSFCIALQGIFPSQN